MKVNIKFELKTWTIYFTTVVLSCFVHELGHCIPAWIHGYWAVPTPAKVYTSPAIPVDLHQYVSCGGILGSILFTLVALYFYVTKTYKFSSAILAGAMASPGVYVLRFLLKGRGHDETEFQEAQSALGFSYSGHSLDWIFLFIFLSATIIWIIKSKPGFKISGRLLIGSILTFIFLIELQNLNNLIFDPIFQTK